MDLGRLLFGLFKFFVWVVCVWFSGVEALVLVLLAGFRVLTILGDDFNCLDVTSVVFRFKVLGICCSCVVWLQVL